MTVFDAAPHIWLSKKEASSLATELSFSFPALTASVKDGTAHGSSYASFLVEVTCEETLMKRIYSFSEEWVSRRKLA